MEIGILICFFIWIIYSICGLRQGTRDEKNTTQWREWSKERDDLVYYDYKSGCTRYTKTGEKCIKLRGLDVNGEVFEYVATKPIIGPQKIKGLRYSDLRKRNEMVQVSPKQMETWKKNGNM